MQVLWGNREDIQRTEAQTVKTAQSWKNMGVVIGVYQGITATEKCTKLLFWCLFTEESLQVSDLCVIKPMRETGPIYGC